MNVLPVCMSGPNKGQKRALDPLELSYRWCKPPCGCWESNQILLKAKCSWPLTRLSTSNLQFLLDIKLIVYTKIKKGQISSANDQPTPDAIHTARWASVSSDRERKAKVSPEVTRRTLGSIWKTPSSLRSPLLRTVITVHHYHTLAKNLACLPQQQNPCYIDKPNPWKVMTESPHHQSLCRRSPPYNPSYNRS